MNDSAKDQIVDSVKVNILEDFLNSHYSVRRFNDENISEEIVRRIIQMARRAPTSSNLQMCSIVVIRDPQTKETLSELCGSQKHIIQCPVFFVFLADFYPISVIAKERGYPFRGDYLEPFILATVDAALCAGRALTAAQALDYGGVLVGGIRNNAESVAKLLDLPEFCYAVCGMSMGRPEKPGKKRLRIEDAGLTHFEKYDRNAFRDAIPRYDDEVSKMGWYTNREVPIPDGATKLPSPDIQYDWSEHSSRRMGSSDPGTLRASLRPFLETQGFKFK